MVDPTGFREIVAANPLLITGVYILLAMGGLLFLLGFLGCCGAIRENKCLLLFVSTTAPHCPPRGPEPALQGLTLRSGPPRPFSRSLSHVALQPQLPDLTLCWAVWASCLQVERGLNLQAQTARLLHGIVNRECYLFACF